MDLSAVSSALQTISGPLIQEVISLWGVKDEVDSLERELKWMQSFLKDADAVKVADSELIRTYVAEVRELAYDAEDVIETFAFKVASKRKGGISGFLRSSFCCLQEGCLLHKTKSEIGKISARITELSRRLQTYDVKKIRDDQEGGPSSSNIDQRRESRRPYPHIIEDNIVGLDADIRNVASILVDEELHHDCRVVSICGMGGLGKTTLAKKVYNDSQIRSHFSYFAWVYISQQCQKRKLWEEILSALNRLDKEDRKRRDEELAEKLFNILKEEKCLLILDDIWSIEAWDSIKPAFPTRETSSKILLTSRNKEVVSHADRKGYLYELQCLKDEQSWELFQKIAFSDKTVRVESCMEELGKGMIKHCAGLPLAIVVLGGILATKCSVIEWQKVSKNVKRYLKGGKGQGIEHVLDLSYDDLPPYSRPCFLYLSHFPEDYKIESDRLIQLWIAEGFVSMKQDDQEDEGETLEDVAECYLIDLMQRYMIQAEERDVIGKVKTCRMHDVIRDACSSRAKQENSVHIIDHSVAANDYSSPLITIGKVPRVAVHTHFLVERIQNPHLRSLMFFSDIFPYEDEFLEGFLEKERGCIDDNCVNDNCCGICIMIFSLGIIIPLYLCLYFCFVLPKICGAWRYMVNNFRLLRVLDYEGEENFGGCKLPDGLGNLIHLRFLSLRNFDFLLSKLPSSLGNLKCLRTLDLRLRCFDPHNYYTHNKIHVPNVILKLRQLRHLYLPSRLKRQTRLRLDTLVNLQTLVNFNMRNCYVAHLLSLINLRKLEILWIPGANYEAFEKHLKKNPQIITSINLRSLSFENNWFESQEMDPTHLVQFLSNCVNIYELHLRRTEMSKLPHYRHFPSDMAYVSLEGTKLHEDPMPTLEKLPNLRILNIGEDAFTGNKMVCSAQGFPRLDSLIIKGLQELEEWEVEEGPMLALRHLEISGCRKLGMLPEGLRFIATLQELKITDMPYTFREKLVQGGEDFHKIQHILSINV